MGITILLFVFFSLVLVRMGKKHAKKQTTFLLLSGWLLKCLAGAAFVYVYTFHYGKGTLSGDSYAYFREARVLVDCKKENSKDFYSVLFNNNDDEKIIRKLFRDVPDSRFSRNDFLVNDTRNLIKTTALFMLIFGDNQNALFLVFFFLSYLGFAMVWLTLKSQITFPSWLSFSLLILPVSILFWTSSNLKEPLYILGMCLLLVYFISSKKTTSVKIQAILGTLLLLLFKPLVLLLFILGGGIYLFIHKILILKEKKYWLYSLFGISFLCFFSLPKIALKTISDKQFDFVNVAKGGHVLRDNSSLYFIDSKYRNNLRLEDTTAIIVGKIPATSNPLGKVRNEKNVVLVPSDKRFFLVQNEESSHSAFEIIPLNNRWENLLQALPEALINFFFRPFPWGSDKNGLNFIFFVENLLFFGLLVFIFFNLKAIHPKHQSVVFTALFSIFILGLLIGITTPVSGAIVRYRIPVQLLIIIVFSLTKWNHERSN